MPSKAEKLAKKIFKLKNIKSLTNAGGGFEKKFKVVVFVPEKNTDELAASMASAGAGIIGNYTLCSFRTPGTGTFKGNTDSNPSIGVKGEYEWVSEIRLEMICDKKNIDSVIEKIFETHPYDEPAYDIYEVMTKNKKSNGSIMRLTLKKRMPVKEIVKAINPKLKFSIIPRKMRKLRISESIIDCSESGDINPEKISKNTLYIKKNKNNYKAYFI
jgi:hypothetical protein